MKVAEVSSLNESNKLGQKLELNIQKNYQLRHYNLDFKKTILLVCFGYQNLSRESLLSLLPVDDAPDGLEIVDLDVLVLEVVSVLPSVNTDNGDMRTINNVLVRLSNNIKSTSLLVLNNPSPAGTLDASKLSIDVADEGVKGTVVLSDSLAERRVGGRRNTTTLGNGGKVLPEKRVVDMATTVESNGRGQLDLGSNVVLDLGLRELLNGSVVAIDVSLMVLGVVEL